MAVKKSKKNYYIININNININNKNNYNTNTKNKLTTLINKIVNFILYRRN